MTLLILMASSCSRKKTALVAPELYSLLKEVFPEQMKDGVVKVAVVSNLDSGSFTDQFLEGCVSEGSSMGIIVNTFITKGDSAKCQEILAKAIKENYDGIILSHGEDSYTYNALKPAVDKGIKVVTFDSVPYINGDTNGTILAGVTSTAQEDYKLAELSLNSIVDSFPVEKQPIKVIRAWMGPGVPPLDRRQTVYDRYVKEGKIIEIAHVGPVDASSPTNFTHDLLAALLSLDAFLPEYATGSVDAIWASYDELAKGCLQALDESGRKDIKIMSIDISNDDINLMLSHPNVWVSTAAVDPKLVGIADMRLLAAKFAGEPTPETYSLDAQLIKAEQLNLSINMTNLASVVPGWGQETGVFDSYPWMAALKAATANN